MHSVICQLSNSIHDTLMLVKVFSISCSILDPLYSTTKPNRRRGVGIAVQTIDRCLSRILKYVEDVQVGKVSSNPQVDRSAALYMILMQ